MEKLLLNDIIGKRKTDLFLETGFLMNRMLSLF